MIILYKEEMKQSAYILEDLGQWWWYGINESVSVFV
jgi:hypothetical protein